MDLSAIVAKRKIMDGGKNRVLPKTNRNVALTADEYSFKKMSLFVTKQAVPASKNSSDDTRGRTRVPFFMPAALKKRAHPATMTHRDKIRAGR